MVFFICIILLVILAEINWEFLAEINWNLIAAIGIIGLIFPVILEQERSDIIEAWQKQTL